MGYTTDPNGCGWGTSNLVVAVILVFEERHRDAMSDTAVNDAVL